ncbi:MAG: baseplate J/gp47 family protein [Zoogloeaceae bacterium]|jgi:phage-related baseplate assembly protein|nr:baseplate J/gp47 family protein [Zoogloeaceae bacterium]
MTDAIDLALLPPPDIIESLDFERIYAARKAHFLSLYPEDERETFASRLEIEGEPIVIVLQEIAYAELILRARINDAARSNLLAFATGGDLDQLAAFYGLTRMANETDARFRKRVGVQIAAIAGNGTRERYVSVALVAHPSVIDAAVLSRQPGVVDVALWIADLPADAPLPPNTEWPAANVAHHAAVAAVVEAALDQHRMLGVPLVVYEAAPCAVDVLAVVVREATAPVTLTADLSERLPALIAEHAQLGRDVARSRILSWLHVAGVSRVELITPNTDLIIPADGYAAPGAIQIADGGLSW